MPVETVTSQSRPAGEGWSISGYEELWINVPKYNSGGYTQNIPIWTKDAPQEGSQAQAYAPMPNPLQDQIAAAQAQADAARNRPVSPFSPTGSGSSQPASGTGATVQQLYQQILGRAPESQEALDYWNKAFGDSIDSSEVLEFNKVAQQELLGRSAPGQGTPASSAGATGFDNAAATALKALQIQLQQQNQAMMQQADEQSRFLRETMQAQQLQYTAQLEQSRQQQAALQAQAAEQRKQSEALQRAYVPNLEPTAASPSIGDARRITRNAANNTLSTLAVLTGIGGTGPSGAASTLAGLQIA